MSLLSPLSSSTCSPSSSYSQTSRQTRTQRTTADSKCATKATTDRQVKAGLGHVDDDRIARRTTSRDGVGRTHRWLFSSSISVLLASFACMLPFGPFRLCIGPATEVFGPDRRYGDDISSYRNHDDQHGGGREERLTLFPTFLNNEVKKTG